MHSQQLKTGFAILLFQFCITLDGAKAQVAVQDFPGFFTPTPGTQSLLPPPKPFTGEVVELDLLNETSAKSIQASKSQVITINDIEIEGNRFYSAWAIRRSLTALLKASHKPMTYQQIEDEIQRVNKFNSFKLKATIQKNEMSDSSGKLHLDVYEQQPLQVIATFDNQGRPGAGLYRPSVQLVDDSLLLMGDQLKTNVMSTPRDHRVAVDYKIPFNSSGGAATLHYDYQFVNFGTTTALNGPRFNPALNVTNHYWEGMLEQPLDKNRVWTPYATIGFRNITSRNGDAITSEPRNRTFGLGIKINKKDKWGSTVADVGTLIGIKSKHYGGDFGYFRFKTSATRVINLPHHNKLTFRSTVQLTPDAMPTASEMQLGGAYGVRGYTEGLVTGDKAMYYGVEHQWPIPFLRQVSPYMADRIQGVSFIDYGRAWLSTNSARYVHGVTNSINHSSLLGAGIGVRAQLSQYAQGFCDIGFGFGSRNAIELNANPAFRVHFGLRSDLLPKIYKTHNIPHQVISHKST